MSRTDGCFHCGEPLPNGPLIFAQLDGIDQPMCCIGCKAVAEFIHSAGLTAFYEFRSQPDSDLQPADEPGEWQHYDSADLLARYVHEDRGAAETTLDIGGMYCTACVWLLDKALNQIDAIENVTVNPATRRAVIRWDATRLKFSELLAAISRIGFKPLPVGVGQSKDTNDEEYRRSLKRLIVAGAAGMQVMMFAVALYAGDYFGIEAGVEKFLRTISLLVTIPIVFYSARPFFASAWRGIRARTPGMDLPVSIAIAAAFFASVWATWMDQGNIYFDSVAMFVLFLSATRFLEMRARHRADDYAVALARLLPDTATRIVGGGAEIVALDRIRVGDVIMIRPGEVVPIDGEMLTGSLAVDESMLTGESLPVSREPGTQVYAGGINRSGNGTLRVTRTGASTSLAEIGRLLERAQADKPPIAVLADRIASRFVLALLAVASITALIWINIDPSRTFEVVLATLVVTCPCALSLATPAALAAAASRLASSGFLLVRSRVLEVLNQASTIVFDKTGTLTAGQPVILETRSFSAQSPEYQLQLAAAIEMASEHVLARAFSIYYRSAYFNPVDIQVEPGCGVQADINGQRYRIGNAGYVAELSNSKPVNEPGDDARILVYLGDDSGLLARFAIGDEVRSDAADAVAELQRAGFNVVIASGDNAAAVSEVASQLDISDWHAAMSPAKKLEFIRKLQADGQSVVMVGDGINDAPVLAAADASIALDAGTALARASADAIALGKRLGTIVEAVGVARATRRIIRQNIAWAIIYNVTAVPLAVSGILAPWMAAIGMSISSLIVVLNALRLHRFRKNDEPMHLEKTLPSLGEEAVT
jgi:Cu2+-exporting ATPase